MADSAAAFDGSQAEASEVSLSPPSRSDSENGSEEEDSGDKEKRLGPLTLLEILAESEEAAPSALAGRLQDDGLSSTSRQGSHSDLKRAASTGSMLKRSMHISTLLSASHGRRGSRTSICSLSTVCPGLESIETKLQTWKIAKREFRRQLRICEAPASAESCRGTFAELENAAREIAEQFRDMQRHWRSRCGGAVGLDEGADANDKCHNEWAEAASEYIHLDNLGSVQAKADFLSLQERSVDVFARAVDLKTDITPLYQTVLSEDGADKGSRIQAQKADLKTSLRVVDRGFMELVACSRKAARGPRPDTRHFRPGWVRMLSPRSSRSLSVG